MNPPKIFISATSGDLSSARQIAKDALLTINCHPVEQTNFEPDWRSVTDMLRGKISDCQALIHLVGFRYGAEPDPSSLPPGTPRRSYTQMEYHLARELGLRVYTFLLPETYSFDVPAKADTSEQIQLQAAHRAHIQGSPLIYDDCATNDLELRTRIIALQEKVLTLEFQNEEVKDEVQKIGQRGLKALVLIGAFLAVIGFGIYTIKERTEQIRQHQEGEKKRLADEALGDRVITAYQDTFRYIRQNESGLANSVIDKQVREQLPSLLNEDSDTVSRILDQNALRISVEKAVPVDRKLRALFVLREYDKVRELGENQIVDSSISSFRTMGDAAVASFELSPRNERREDALRYYSAAAELAGKTVDPSVWSEIQAQSAEVLNSLGRSKEAADLLDDVIEIMRMTQSKSLSVALNNRGVALYKMVRYQEASVLMKEALELDQKNLGRDHRYVAIRLQNLAMLDLAMQQPDEAEKKFQQALEVIKRQPKKDSLAAARVFTSYGGLIMQIGDIQRISSEGRKLLEVGLRIKEKILGLTHPEVAHSHNDLGMLYLKLALSDYADANKEELITLAEKSLKKGTEIDVASQSTENPEAAIRLSNYASVLIEREKFDEAELILTRAIDLDIRLLGEGHLNLAIKRQNLAHLFYMTDRLTKAVQPLKQAIIGYFKFMKSNRVRHPNLRLAVLLYIKIHKTLGVDPVDAYHNFLNLGRTAGFPDEIIQDIYQNF
ncbi:MAG: tetratricopeptide repeat protein [Prosthecobacter sp.]